MRFSLKVQYFGAIAHSIGFIKREAFEIVDLRLDESGEHLSRQLQVVNLGYVGEDFNIFELAANYMEYSFTPLFDSYKQVKSISTDKTGASGGFDSI